MIDDDDDDVAIASPLARIWTRDTNELHDLCQHLWADDESCGLKWITLEAGGSRQRRRAPYDFHYAAVAAAAASSKEKKKKKRPLTKNGEEVTEASRDAKYAQKAPPNIVSN